MASWLRQTSFLNCDFLFWKSRDQTSSQYQLVELNFLVFACKIFDIFKKFLFKYFVQIVDHYCYVGDLNLSTRMFSFDWINSLEFMCLRKLDHGEFLLQVPLTFQIFSFGKLKKIYMALGGFTQTSVQIIWSNITTFQIISFKKLKKNKALGGFTQTSVQILWSLEAL